MDFHALRRVVLCPVLVGLWFWEFERFARVVDAFARKNKRRKNVARHARLVEVGMVLRGDKVSVSSGKLAPVKGWVRMVDGVKAVVEGKKVQETASEIAGAVDGVSRARVAAVVL